MTDRIHDALVSGGEAWRGGLGPDPDLSVLFHRRPPRRRAYLVAAAAAIAVVGAGAFLALDRLSWNQGGAAASCVSPVLAVVRGDTIPKEPGHPTSLGPVPRGTVVHVYGSNYVLPCDDTVEVGQPLPSRPGPLPAVPLTLVTADGRTRALLTAHPDEDGSFAARAQIPPDAAPGPATITTPEGQRIVLVVT
jgi:hypothetical protein